MSRPADPFTLRRALATPDRPHAGAGDLVEICGTVETIEHLVSTPLPAEAFDWTAVPDDDRELVSELLEQITPVIAEWLEPEYLTVLHRLIARAAAEPTQPLRRRAKTDRLAAVLVWVAMKANADIGPRCRWSGADVWWWFDVSDCGALARQFAGDLGFLRPDRMPYLEWGGPSPVYTGDVSLLHARARQALIRHRDFTIDVLQRIEEQKEARRKVVPRPDGKVEIRATVARPIGVVKEVTPEGRATVIVLLGDSIDDPDDVFGFSVPDARDLLHGLQRALNAPLPAG